MRNPIRKYWYLTVAALLFLAAGAFAQCPTSFPATVTCTTATYNGATYGVNGSVAAPQMATIGGVSYEVISDDYVDTAIPGLSSTLYSVYQQSVTGLDSSADHTMFGSSLPGSGTGTQAGYGLNYWGGKPGLTGVTAQQIYELGAVLGTQMLSATTDCTALTPCQAEYQEAIWYLFDPADWAGYFDCTSCTPTPSDTLTRGIIAGLGSDLAGIGDGSSLSNVQVITPSYSQNGDPPCSAGNTLPANPLNSGCGNPEFLAIATPESSAPVILGANLLGLAALVFFFRRRLVLVKD